MAVPPAGNRTCVLSQPRGGRSGSGPGIAARPFPRPPASVLKPQPGRGPASPAQPQVRVVAQLRQQLLLRRLLQDVPAEPDVRWTGLRRARPGASRGACTELTGRARGARCAGRPKQSDTPRGEHGRAWGHGDSDPPADVYRAYLKAREDIRHSCWPVERAAGRKLGCLGTTITALSYSPTQKRGRGLLGHLSAPPAVTWGLRVLRLFPESRGPWRTPAPDSAGGRQGHKCVGRDTITGCPPAASLPLPPSLPTPGAEQKPLPVHTPEQELHSHLIGGLRVSGEGLQVTAAVPLVEEVLESRREWWPVGVGLA